MKRRNFIWLTSAGFTALAVPGLLTQCSPVQYDQTLFISRQLTSIWDLKTMLAAGEEYQKLYPDENNERKLVKLLLEGTSTENGKPVNLDQEITSDYKNDQMVILNGWMLSVTEGRQCALLFINQSKNS